MKNNIKVTKFEIINKNTNERLEMPNVYTTIIRDDIEMVIHEIFISDNDKVNLLCHVPYITNENEYISDDEIIIPADELFDKDHITITNKNYVLKTSDIGILYGDDSLRFNYIKRRK